mgnify:FL=1
MNTIKHNLLLADDDTDDCIFFKEVLEELGVDTTLTVVNDGVELMRLLSKKTDSLPDVLFLDLNMPVKDGFGFLEDFASMDEAIRQRSKVIVLSSSISPDDINRASTNPYVHKYINKPLSEKYLEAVE